MILLMVTIANDHMETRLNWIDSDKKDYFHKQTATQCHQRPNAFLACITKTRWINKHIYIPIQLSQPITFLEWGPALLTSMGKARDGSSFSNTTIISRLCAMRTEVIRMKQILKTDWGCALLSSGSCIMSQQDLLYHHSCVVPDVARFQATTNCTSRIALQFYNWTSRISSGAVWMARRTSSLEFVRR